MEKKFTNNIVTINILKVKKNNFFNCDFKSKWNKTLKNCNSTCKQNIVYYTLLKKLITIFKKKLIKYFRYLDRITIRIKIS